MGDSVSEKTKTPVNDDVKLSSFDRLFPNQDRLSGKRLGNLIVRMFMTDITVLLTEWAIGLCCIGVLKTITERWGSVPKNLLAVKTK